MAFKLISAEELFYQPLDPAKAEMIIEDMILQGLTLIAGAPKSGKSWMMLDMCLAVSSGRSFLGRKTLRCEVAYFPLEDQEERVKKRMLDLGEAVDEKEMQSNMLSAKISKFYYTVFYPAGITMTQKRTASERLMTLTYQPEPENNAPVEEPSHTSRRTNLTKLLDGHVHLDSVMKIAGHCDKKTTLSNYYYDRSSAEEKVRLVEQALAN